MAFIFNPNNKKGVFMIPSGATKSPTPTPSFTNKYSLAFDGVYDYLDISPPIPLGLTSISFWMKSTDTGGNKGITNGLGQLNFIGTRPIVRLSPSNYRYFADQVSNFDGNWHHWFLLISGSGTLDIISSRLFVDGVEVLAETTGASGVPLSWSVSQIGKGFYGSINASIDEFAIWQSDETANVSTIYNSGTPTNLSDLTTPPLHWYRNGDNGTWKSPQWLIPSNENKDKVSNYSFAFDGVDDNIDTGITSTGTNNVSISCWIKTTETFASTENRCAFGGSDLTFGTNYTLGRLGSEFLSPNDMKVRVFNTFGTTKLNDGAWHNIIFTYDYTTKEIKAYVDGNTTPEISITNGLFSSKIIAIGSDGAGSFFFNGNIDECAYWTSILGTSDITDIYNSGTPTTLPSGAVAHWKMGENATFLTNWTVPDEVGSATGTSANMTIEDRIGEAPNSLNNSLSINMDEVDRETDTP